MKAGFFFSDRNAGRHVIDRIDHRTTNRPPSRRVLATLALAVTRILDR